MTARTPDEVANAVIGQVIAGRSNREVADSLGLSKRTVARLWRLYSRQFATDQADEVRRIQLAQLRRDLQRADQALDREEDGSAVARLLIAKHKLQDLYSKLTGTAQPVRAQLTIDREPKEVIERIEFVEVLPADQAPALPEGPLQGPGLTRMLTGGTPEADRT